MSGKAGLGIGQAPEGPAGRHTSAWDFSFPIFVPLFSFSFLMVLAKMSSFIWNTNSENGHSFLPLNHGGNTSSFSPFNMILAKDINDC